MKTVILVVSVVAALALLSTVISNAVKADETGSFVVYIGVNIAFVCGAFFDIMIDRIRRKI